MSARKLAGYPVHVVESATPGVVVLTTNVEAALAAELQADPEAMRQLEERLAQRLDDEIRRWVDRMVEP